jgi:NifU-like protein involved in Fe-S cluster formation
LLEHFRNPRNAGLMRQPDGVGEAEDPGCLDRARFFVRVRDGRVAEARFQAYGCGPTIAAASAASELVEGAALAEAAALDAGRVEQALDGLPEDRRHAAEVVAAALRAAARDALARWTRPGPGIRAGAGGIES